MYISLQITCFKFKFNGLGGLRFLRFDSAGITASTSSGNTSKSETNLLLRKDLFDEDLLGIPLPLLLLFSSDCCVVLFTLSGDFVSVNWVFDVVPGLCSPCVSSISLFEESLPV